MGYKVKSDRIIDNKASLPEKLNTFYASFEQVVTCPGNIDATVPMVTVADFILAFLRVNL